MDAGTAVVAGGVAGGARGKGGRPRRYGVNHEFFSSWTADVAWVLGYVCADATVRDDGRRKVLTFRCHPRDRCILEAVRGAMGADYPIGQWANTDGSPTVGFTVSSDRIVTDLAGHGVLPRKSYGDPAMPDVPDDLLGAFFRGLFDGDGCFDTPKHLWGRVAIVGSRTLLAQLSERASRVFGIRPRPVRRHKSIWMVDWADKSSLRPLYDAMYPPGFRGCCERKREAFAAALGRMPASHCRKESKTGYRGVSRHTTAKCRYVANWRGGGRMVYLGMYPTPAEAAVAYNAGAEFFIGTAAVLNPIPPEVSAEAAARIRQDTIDRLRGRDRV